MWRFSSSRPPVSSVDSRRPRTSRTGATWAAASQGRMALFALPTPTLPHTRIGSIASFRREQGEAARCPVQRGIDGTSGFDEHRLTQVIGTDLNGARSFFKPRVYFGRAVAGLALVMVQASV